MKKPLIRKWRVLQKLVAAVGGFMILAGIMLLGIAILAASGFLNVGLILERKYLLTFALPMVVVGLFDTFAAIILARW